MVLKRKDSSPPQRNLSPPPTKRRIESTTTKKAVAKFFAPASKKEPAKLEWRILEHTLLVGKHTPASRSEPLSKRRKIAAFDFDSTLIRTSSGNVFGKDATDWMWWHPTVPGKLRALHDDGNQGGIVLESAETNGPKRPKSRDEKRLADFKAKVGYVLEQLDRPVNIYAATSKTDRYRKPRPGMWTELLEELDLDRADADGGPDLAASFFVGDAGGRLAESRQKADHSNSDRDFAANAGIAFHTPEEYFLSERPRPFVRKLNPLDYVDTNGDMPGRETASETQPAFQKKNKADVVLFCGSPGSGKSTFFWTYLRELGYERVNQDTLKTRDRCLKTADNLLGDGKSVVIDNTNAETATRKLWIDLANRHEVSIRCIHFTAPTALCMHNDVVRALNPDLLNPEKRDMLPITAFTSFASRFQEPRAGEGFQDVMLVPFRFRGTEEQRQVWCQHWT